MTPAAQAGPNLRHKGAPHSGAIDRIAVAPDGKSALSRDQTGGVRLWPALDGAAEPVPLPARGVEQMSLSPRSDGAWTVALVEASGQAQFLRVDAKGDVKPLAALPPHDPVVEAHVLAGGKQLVVLYRDFTIRLLDASGRELGRYERRKFSPRSLRVSDDGKRVVAIVLERLNGATHEGYLQPLDIVGNKFAAKAPERFRTPLQPTRQNAVLSPTGATFVMLAPDRQGRNYLVLVHNLDRPGSRRTFPSELRVHAEPSLGFASAEALVLSSEDANGTAWQLNTRSGRTVPRTGPPREVRATAMGAGVQVGGYGTWLYVQNIRDSATRYLGFDSFRPAAAAFSPTGSWLAWGYDRSEIYIEPFYGPPRAPTRLENDVADAMRHLFFVGDDHVIGVDSRNNIVLLQWSQGKIIAETSVPWRVRRVVYEPDSHVLMLDGGSEGKRVFTVDPSRGFSGQFILPDTATQSGLFSRAVGGDAVLWTANGADKKLRTYSLAELQRGLAADEVVARGELLPPGDLVAIDRVGNRYVLDRGRLSVGRGVQVKTIEVQPAGVFPSWNGETVLIFSREAGGLVLTAYDTAELKEKWTHRMEVPPTTAVWSPDGKYVALAAETGALILDVADGKPIAFRCGLDFEARGTPPKEAFSSSRNRSVCEP